MIPLLLSNNGITYAEHFCGDHKMMGKITLGEAHLSCGMTMPVSDCEDGPEVERHCCDNQYTTVETDDNYSGVSHDLQLSPVFVASFVAVFVLDLSWDYPQHIDYFKDYSPPPLGDDLQVLYETFLI
ncbi:MAG: hypothetical protein AAF466_10700 [Bacteroidota bacterium]